MNFRWAIQKCLEHEKVRRSCWDKEHYWTSGVDKRLINSIGETPSINKAQLEALDWELSKEEKDFCLSDKRNIGIMDNYYAERDVKTFIRKLKEQVYIEMGSSAKNHFILIMDKLAGDKLI